MRSPLLFSSALVGLLTAAPAFASESLPPLPPPARSTSVIPPLEPSTQRHVSSGAVALVHIETEESVSLQRETRSGWITVCERKCDQELVIEPRYRLAGVGIQPSEPFTLSGPGPLILNVETVPIHRGGVAGLVLGPLAMLGGVGLTYLAATAPEPNCIECEEDLRPTAAVLGVLMVIGGVVGFASGVNVVTHPHKPSEVKQRPAQAQVIFAQGPARSRAANKVRKPDFGLARRDGLPAAKTATVLKIKF